ncbi:hypothetical protein LIPSTDRAFT_4695 [Lipomyces starkeyi NRRL Y-11557]|uniref:DDE-1 domain-containing protein n=1 Tax=Lipomyces starkeyi NRRL Y-11557 TaxID=675824 RepID=A0A1E3Q2R6_LIPST|nr:hypothetical protein LIPSTDRAFT_4695 [Lipomyces starkeyi NRRL Y-11557]
MTTSERKAKILKSLRNGSIFSGRQFRITGSLTKTCTIIPDGKSRNRKDCHVCGKRRETILKQSGNREWVTVVEWVNASGWRLPPLVIFQGKVHQSPWFCDIPEDRSTAVSCNGWTTNELGLQWLQDVFEKNTCDRTKGRYRLLVLDGHRSHKGRQRTPGQKESVEEGEADIIVLNTSAKNKPRKI